MHKVTLIPGDVVSPIAILGLLLLATACIRAEEPRDRFEVFIQGGASFFSSTSETTTLSLPAPFPPTISTRAKSSLATTGRLFTGARYYATAKDALELSYSYSPSRSQTTVTSSLPALSGFFSESMRVHNAAFNYVRYLSGERRVQPFVTGGLGIAVFDRRTGPTSTNFAVNFGGGVDIRLTQQLRLRAELRDFVSERPALSTERATHNVVPTVGLAFKF